MRLIGQVIGSYRIVSELGHGGMGVVFRAEHVQLGRPAALKVLLPQMSADAQIVQRFFNEARAASSIDHPGIVEVYDFGRHTDGRAYLVMEMLKGESLDHRLARPMAPLEAASLIAQVAGALAAAHAQGIVHRDLKPDNIFLVPNELLPGGIQVKLLDFGIAKLADEGTSGFKTQTGVLIGTPAYMSPEQCMGRADLDHRTDLYAVGCIFYHMLCGRPPFLSDQGTGVMIAMHLRDAVPDPRAFAPHLPPALVEITLRLLEKDPAARFQSAQALRQALVSAGAVAPPTAPPAMTGAVPDPYGATLALAMPAGSLPRGPGDAYGATAATAAVRTTRSDAAAELMTQPERVHNRGSTRGRAGARGRRGAWIGVGALLLVGGGIAAAVVATRGGGDGVGAEPAVTAAAAPEPGSAHEGSASPEPAKPASPEPASPEPASPEPASAEPCPVGQLRTEDTRGQCCWADQAWSTSNKRCVGAPTCPPGMRASGEECTPAPAEEEPPQAPAQIATPDPAPVDPLAAAPAIRLGAASFQPGASIEIRFAQAIRSAQSRRAWVTVAPAGSPQTSYGTWTFVEDGARRASLAAPSKPGAYEVRLHTEYPAQAFHVVRAVPFAVDMPAEAPTVAPPDRPAPVDATPPSGQRFALASATVRAGDKAVVRFPGPLRAATGERFWITVIEAGAPDTGWGKWEYVPAGARTISLAVPAKAGSYEIRLHANYPKKSTNVVFRAALRVEAP